MIRVRFGVNSKGENVTFNSNSLFFNIINRFGGHSVGVIPGLVSIPEVKSLRVWFVYYGFRSMGISFCCQLFYSITYHLFIIIIGLAVIALGLYLVSFRSQKLSLYAFGLCTMGFGLWEFPFAASLFLSKIF